MNDVPLTIKKTRILLFGFINLNVMDGSAVFLSGITSMFAMSKNLEIDLVLANPVQRDLLIRPLIQFPNVNVISPYEEPDLISSNPNWLSRAQMTHEEAGKVIDYYWNKDSYDWFFIRGLEVAEQLMHFVPSILSSTLLYVTGVTHEDQVLPEERQKKLEELFTASAYLLCQTKEMKDYISKNFNHVIEEKKIITLNPMIPDTTSNFNEVFIKKDSYTKLCYTGKFDVGWNSIPIIVAFRELRESYPSLTLDIAGDKFNQRKDHPYFIKDLKYLLENTTNLKWYGAVSRKEARNIIVNSDIGITWRDKSMDSSLELSTKLLEYGSLGKAVILNPTKMHRRLFGDDYPLYAETFDEFLYVIEKIQKDPKVYEIAAKRMFDVSQDFTYSVTLSKLLPFLNKEKRIIETFFNKNNLKVPVTLADSNINKKTNIQRHDVFTVTDKPSDLLCVSQNLHSYDEVKSYFREISKLGIIDDAVLIENNVISILKKSTLSEFDTYLSNIDSNIYKEIIKQISHQDIIKNMQNGKLSGLNNNQRTVSLPEESFNYYEFAQKTSNKDTAEIEKELKTLRKEHEILKKKYNAIIRSKLGKITVKYWSFNKKLKGKK